MNAGYGVVMSKPGRSARVRKVAAPVLACLKPSETGFLTPPAGSKPRKPGFLTPSGVV
jgi:hypothetical protein